MTLDAAHLRRVTVFGPHPLLTVAIERRGEEDAVHLHAGGQGVWASSMAGRLGAWPVLCGFTGGETGAVVAGLLAAQSGERRMVASEYGIPGKTRTVRSAFTFLNTRAGGMKSSPSMTRLSASRTCCRTSSTQTAA